MVQREKTILKEQFRENGYVVLPGFLSSAEVTDLKSEINRYVRDVFPQAAPGEAFYEVKGQPETLKQLQRMFQYGDWFRNFFFAQRFTGLAEFLLESPVVGKNLQWFNKPPAVSSPTPLI
jgi:phytanoyl-CoA hydroxylase